MQPPFKKAHRQLANASSRDAGSYLFRTCSCAFRHSGCIQKSNFKTSRPMRDRTLRLSCLFSLFVPLCAHTQTAEPTARSLAKFATLPLSFVQTPGSSTAQAHYSTLGPGYTISLDGEAATLTLIVASPQESTTARQNPASRASSATSAAPTLSLAIRPAHVCKSPLPRRLSRRRPPLPRRSAKARVLFRSSPQRRP
jgi:hypothetical protein